ncbi:MAG TPA: hypothetical protein VD997_17730 [Phycisphaerales bacterium]|nr:hypothetical protein [Phycisphaerales bacterium]
MGFTYTVDESLGLARVVWTGDVTPELAGEAIHAVSSDPRVKPSFCRLVNMQAARIQIPRNSNRDLAAAKANGHDASSAKTNGKTAIVVGDELSFGIASQYAAYSELQGFPTEVFRDMGSAEKWLALGSSVAATV